MQWDFESARPKIALKRAKKFPWRKKQKIFFELLSVKNAN